MKRTLELIVVVLILAYYNAVMWYGHVFELSQTVSLEYMKPYVYRQLVPVIIRAMGWVRVDIATVIVTTCAGVGFYLSLCTLLKNKPLLPLFAVLIGLFLFSMWHKVYDFMTAWLWTILFLKLLDRNYKGFSMLFLLLCLNRIETALFIIPIYFLIERNWKFSILLSVLFVLLFVFLRFYFSDNVGVSALVEPTKNIHRLITHWELSLAHLLIFAVPFLLAVRQFSIIGQFYLILFPVFVVLYVVFGQAFEIRVFWEIYPLLISIISTSIPSPSSTPVLNFATDS